MPESSERINCPDTKKKAQLTLASFKGVNDGQYGCVLPCFFPDLPRRPNKPELLVPKHVPKRRISTGRIGRVALLHAIAYNELNAIALALDMAGQYATYGPPFDFVRDWLLVANDEAKHFMLLSDRLESMDSFYGACLNMSACGKPHWLQATLWQAEWQSPRLC